MRVLCQDQERFSKILLIFAARVANIGNDGIREQDQSAYPPPHPKWVRIRSACFD